MDNSFNVIVKLITGNTISINVESSYTVEMLKEKIYDKEGKIPDRQKLVFAGKVLENQRSLNSYNIKKDSILFYVLPALR
jgi:hypothetical protein